MGMGSANMLTRLIFTLSCSIRYYFTQLWPVSFQNYHLTALSILTLGSSRATVTGAPGLLSSTFDWLPVFELVLCTHWEKFPAPWEPCGPVGPWAPCEPLNPWWPMIPRDPCVPLNPRDPAGPIGPCEPLSPWGPMIPRGPFVPLNPGGPAGPIFPWEPLKPGSPIVPWSFLKLSTCKRLQRVMNL